LIGAWRNFESEKHLPILRTHFRETDVVISTDLFPTVLKEIFEARNNWPDKIYLDRNKLSNIKINFMSINKEWHLAHPMPPHATIEQRIHWHIEHLKNCGCRRDFPLKLKREMKKRNIRLH
jgi:hypothetical protein